MEGREGGGMEGGREVSKGDACKASLWLITQTIHCDQRGGGRNYIMALVFKGPLHKWLVRPFARVQRGPYDGAAP